MYFYLFLTQCIFNLFDVVQAVVIFLIVVAWEIYVVNEVRSGQRVGIPPLIRPVSGPVWGD